MFLALIFSYNMNNCGITNNVSIVENTSPHTIAEAKGPQIFE
jgi:hypothetical protein